MTSGNLDSSFCKLVENITPTCSFEAFGKKHIEKVKSLIMRNSEYSIDRFIYAGSFGKNTDILIPDFDIVFFVNYCRPPFEKVLDEWRRILKTEDGRLISKGSLMVTDISLQFEIVTPQGCLQVDLLPAANLIPKNIQPRPGGKKLHGLQKCCAQGLITHRNKNLFSSSLSEFQINFMKNQDEFIHQLARLGKFWFKTLYLGTKRIYGIKTVLELIAISVGIEEIEDCEETEDDPSLYIAFCNFLDEVSRIDQLQLAFKKNPANRKWEVIIPDGFSESDAFIIDPSNSKNDLTKNFTNRELEIKNVKAFAKTTRNKIVDQCGTSTKKIFLPQPKLFKIMDEIAIRRPTRFCCDSDVSYNSFFCNMEIRNPKLNQESMQRVLGLIQNNLLTFTRASSSEVEQYDTTDSEEFNSSDYEDDISCDSEEVRSTDSEQYVDLNTLNSDLKDFIWEHIFGGNLRSNGIRQMKKANKLRHRDSDVTFRIPAHKSPRAGGLWISFKWG